MSNLSDFLPPPVSFYFNVVFMNVPLVGDMSFQEVSGLGAEMATEELREGGENSFSYQLPTRIKHSNLVMKRPIAPNLLDPLAFWFSMSLGGELVTSVVTVDLSVYLMDALGLPMRYWYVSDAYPVKWDCSSFASSKNELSIETLELAYTKIIRVI